MSGREAIYDDCYLDGCSNNYNVCALYVCSRKRSYVHELFDEEDLCLTVLEHFFEVGKLAGNPAPQLPCFESAFYNVEC